MRKHRFRRRTVNVLVQILEVEIGTLAHSVIALHMPVFHPGEKPL